MNPRNENEILTFITSNKYDRVDTETEKRIHGAFDKCNEKVPSKRNGRTKSQVQQRGLGFMTVRELPEKYNLPLPLVSYQEPYLVFTLPRNAKAIRKVNEVLADLDEGEIKLLNFFKLNDGQSYSKGEVVDKLGISARTAERELKHLVELKLLIRDGVGRCTTYRIAK